MKPLRAYAVPFLVASGLVTVAVAATVNIQEVNLKVSGLTKPFNTADTVMDFAFTTLNIDAVKTLDFGFTGLVSKKNTQNEVKFEFKKAQYTYGDGTKPTVDLDVAVSADLVKMMGQDSLNKFAADLDQIAVNAAKDFGKDYGAAGTVSTKVENRILDKDGNIELLELKLVASIDFAQLPATMPAAKVEFQSIDVLMVASRTGMNLKINFVANPLYQGFQKDGDGLKEYIEKLLNNDQPTYDQLQKYLVILDGVVGYLAEAKP